MGNSSRTELKLVRHGAFIPRTHINLVIDGLGSHLATTHISLVIDGLGSHLATTHINLVIDGLGRRPGMHNEGGV